MRQFEKPNNIFLDILIYVCIFLFIVGGNALSFNLHGISIRYGELFSIILFVCLLPYVFRQKLVRIDPIFIWFLLSVILNLVSYFAYGFSFRQILMGYIYLFRYAVLILLAFILSKYLSVTKQLVPILKHVNVCYLAVCIIGFIQIILFPSALKWYSLFEKIGVYWVGDPHINRLVSTDFDPNYLSCCLLIGVIINLYFIKSKKKNQFARTSIYTNYICLSIYLLAILLTKSRSGILGLGIVVILYFLFTIDRKKITKSDILICFAFVFIGGYFVVFSDIQVFVRIREVFNDASAGARFISWQKSIEIIKDTNFLGIGYNMYGAYNEMFYGALNSSNTVAGVDSSLFLVLITTGLVGFITFIAHYARMYQSVNNAAFRCLLIASIIVCNFNNLLFYSLWILPFYLVGYLIYECEREQVKKSTQFGVQRFVNANLKKTSVVYGGE
ncbi:MAG: O-antigen ligase family protein [Clostridia bacterium]|nr:O-antigen ligase family protein [Clostridia bacterium]